MTHLFDEAGDTGDDTAADDSDNGDTEESSEDEA